MLPGEMSSVRNRTGRMCWRKLEEVGRNTNSTAELFGRIGALWKVTFFRRTVALAG
jgi:hypothetical protein